MGLSLSIQMLTDLFPRFDFVTLEEMSEFYLPSRPLGRGAGVWGYASINNLSFRIYEGGSPLTLWGEGRQKLRGLNSMLRLADG